MSRGLEIVRRCLPFAALALALAVPGARAAAAPPTVAVLYFDYDGADEELFVLRKGLADLIGSQIVAVETIQVVERQRLQEVLAELDLQQTRRMDPASGARVGKLLGARYLVFGSYFQLNGALSATSRVVEVETGKVLYAVSGFGPPDDAFTVQQKLSEGLKGFFEAKLPALAAAAPKAEPRPAATSSAKQKPVKPPARLKLKEAKDYSAALDAIDRKDKVTAVNKLKEVLASNDDFPLAAAQLAALN